MRTTTRVGAGALGAALASGALLTGGTGTAAAQTPAPCDPTKYPPVQCEVVGGNQAGNPPLVADKTIGAPGSPIGVTASSGCTPGTTVTLALLRIATSGQPVVVGTTTANADGGYDISTAIPSSTQPGVYILYTTCQVGGITSVTTTSFVVSGPPATSSTAARTSSTGSAATTSQAPADDAAAADAAVRALDVPEEWTAPAAWDASPQVRAAVTRAVNLRLAALRTSLPATPAQADAPSVRAPGSPVDTTLWVAGGAVAFLLLGAAGWRRHVAAAATTDEVAQ